MSFANADIATDQKSNHASRRVQCAVVSSMLMLSRFMWIILALYCKHTSSYQSYYNYYSTSTTIRHITTTTIGTSRTRHYSTKNAAASTSSTVQPEQQKQVQPTINYGINPMLNNIQPSKTVEIFSLVKQMEAEGIEVTSLCVGEPDFPPPNAVLEAIVEAVQLGLTRYTAVTGTISLRQAIASDLFRRKNGLQYNPQTEIVVGNGAKQCVYQGILAVAGIGDEVLVPAPYWTSYPEMVTLVGAIPIILNTSPENGYLMTPEELDMTLQNHPKCKLLIMCNPSNPTGGVYETTHLNELAQVLLKYPEVKVLADEIYERLVYEGDCPSFASIPGMFHRTITINGFSKSYAMTGMRLGYLAAPAPLAKAVSTIQSQLTSCAGSISQAAGLAALMNVTDTELDANVQIMKTKRDFVLAELATIPNVIVKVPPRGAFYVLPDTSAYGDDVELCRELLYSVRLALVPGSGFGAPGTVRISYATSMEELQVAMNKLRSFLEVKRRSMEPTVH